MFLLAFFAGFVGSPMLGRGGRAVVTLVVNWLKHCWHVGCDDVWFARGGLLSLACTGSMFSLHFPTIAYADPLEEISVAGSHCSSGTSP